MLFIQKLIALFSAVIGLVGGTFGMDIGFLNEKQTDFRVTSYFVSENIQDSAALHSEDFDIITDAILFGCATFDTEGNVNVEQQKLETALTNLRNAIGERDVGITLNILGPSAQGSYSTWEEQMEAMSKEHNKAFTSGKLGKNIVEVLDKYGFDGVHLDYEYPISDKAWFYFNNFLVALDARLGDYTLGIAVSNWNINLSIPAILAVDTVELMMYDLNDAEGRHSAAQDMIDRAENTDFKGLLLSKVNFGLPFYARPSDMSAYWYGYNGYYDKLDEEGWYYDENTGKDFWFNTPEVIYEKTDYAINQGYGGVMVWHYSCDLPSTSEKSLTGAIGRAISDNYA